MQSPKPKITLSGRGYNWQRRGHHIIEETIRTFATSSRSVGLDTFRLSPSPEKSRRALETLQKAGDQLPSSWMEPLPPDTRAEPAASTEGGSSSTPVRIGSAAPLPVTKDSTIPGNVSALPAETAPPPPSPMAWEAEVPRESSGDASQSPPLSPSERCSGESEEAVTSASALAPDPASAGGAPTSQAAAPQRDTSSRRKTEGYRLFLTPVRTRLSVGRVSVTRHGYLWACSWPSPCRAFFPHVPAGLLMLYSARSSYNQRPGRGGGEGGLMAVRFDVSPHSSSLLSIFLCLSPPSPPFLLLRRPRHGDGPPAPAFPDRVGHIADFREYPRELRVHRGRQRWR